MSTVSVPLPAYMAALAPVLADVVGPAAAEIDRTGTYPRAALDALGRAGLLGLISAPEVGGRGEGHRAATAVVQAVAEHCGSTAMVLMMHYCGTAVIEAAASTAAGSADVRERIAAGEYITTLAFSETGSRSMFWAPMSTATASGDGGVRLDAEKSWVTSAGHADGYVWSSKPLAAEGMSTVWLVPAGAAGLKVGAPFDGLGLRGNSSSPMSASGVEVPASAMLGADGAGFDVMLGVVLPYFQVMNAGFSVGTAAAATAKAAAHAAGTRFEHLDQSLADNPVVRANVARMRIRTDAAEALLLDTLNALETGRADATLRVLESKALASETSIDVTDLAMRVSGGAAFRKEVGVERHFRDARASAVMAPTTDTLYEFIGRIACGLPLF
ncbi:MAG: Acyl-CoA dehydrogenase, short-chain specific [Acidimicrobiales bacterium]|nr:Acyl-CoA dehydrogenase, short-chain specific [Acidimicrobiales bacterium]